MVLLVVDAQNGIVDEAYMRSRSLSVNIKKLNWDRSGTGDRSSLCSAR